MLGAGKDAPEGTPAREPDILIAAIERLAARVRDGQAPAEALCLLAELEAARPVIRRRLAASAVRPLWLVRLDRAIHVLVLAVEAQGLATPDVQPESDLEGGRRLAGEIRMLLAASTAVGLLATASAAAADCTVSGSTVNCTGSPGAVLVVNTPIAPPIVIPGLTQFGGAYNRLNVSGLTANIVAPTGFDGLALISGGGAAAEDQDGAAAPGLSANIDTGARTIQSTLATGILINALGQGGGEGSDAIIAGHAHTGGAGGAGGDINAAISANVTTSGAGLSGVQVTSQGGAGGEGGGVIGLGGSGGDGGAGGAGGTVTVTLGAGTISTDGLNAFGVSVGSFGGEGGQGGACGGLWCASNAGGTSANGGVVTVTTAATTAIMTLGLGSDALHVGSIGGFAGGGGNNYALVGYGATGGSAGDGGLVTVSNSARLTTAGSVANGLFAQSVGGGGGAGGSAYGIVSLGGGKFPGRRRRRRCGHQHLGR